MPASVLSNIGTRDGSFQTMCVEAVLKIFIKCFFEFNSKVFNTPQIGFLRSRAVQKHQSLWNWKSKKFKNDLFDFTYDGSQSRVQFGAQNASERLPASVLEHLGLQKSPNMLQNTCPLAFWAILQYKKTFKCHITNHNFRSHHQMAHHQVLHKNQWIFAIFVPRFICFCIFKFFFEFFWNFLSDMFFF